MDEGIEKAPLRGRILAKMTAWKANNHTVGAGHSKWPFVGKRRADTESAPTVRGAMLVIPNKSLKQKIPEQTFEDFGADEGI